MIRLGTEQDFPLIKRRLDKLRLHSIFAPFDVDWARIYNMLHEAVRAEALFVDDGDGMQLLGLVIAAIKPLWWNHNVGIGTELFFSFTSHDVGVALLEKLSEWCFKRGASTIQLCVASQGPLEDVQLVYERAGFELHGSLFVKYREESQHVRPN